MIPSSIFKALPTLNSSSVSKKWERLTTKSKASDPKTPPRKASLLRIIQTEKSAVKSSSRCLSKHKREQRCCVIRSVSLTTGPSNNCKSIWNQSLGCQPKRRAWISWWKANCSKIQMHSFPRATLFLTAWSLANTDPRSMAVCKHQALEYYDLRSEANLIYNKR